LEYLERFNRSILNSLTTNIVVLNEQGIIINVNDAWLDFALKNGVSSPDKVNIGVNYFDVCKKARGEHSDEAPLALNGLLSVLNGKTSYFELDYPCDSPGEKRWFMMRASAFSIEGHRYLVVNHINITERKSAENALCQVHAELEERVKERTVQLEHLNRELHDKIAEQESTAEALRNAKAESDLYVDLMGHDINNMNMVALGHLELVLDKLRPEKKIDEDVIEHLSRSITTLNNVSKLISNVRIIQQVKGGTIEVRVVDIGMMLAEVVHEYRNVPGREVIINYRPVKGYYVKTCELFKDVFTNIIGNAIKHSSGPLVVTVEIDKVRQDDADYYKISVEDNGPGIPDNRKSELFKRHKPEETRATGSGVGLILVRTLVEDFNGKVLVEDRIPGDYTRGARFVVMLPAVEK
jgi:signal transduction histidine kinase